MKIYTEAYLKTKLHCNFLPELEGNITLLDKSQYIFLKCLKDLQLLVIKNEITNLDDSIYKIIRVNLNKYCSDFSIDDSQALTNYIISGIYSYINIFPTKKYYPLIVDFNPTVKISNYDIILNIDLLLKQNNKSNYLHAVTFVHKVDPHALTIDSFNHLKLNFLSNAHIGNRNNNPATHLHLISMPPLTYRNKNIKNYSVKRKHLTEKDIQKDLLSTLVEQLDSSFSIQKPSPIPGCLNFKCSKRKQCVSSQRIKYESR